MTSGRIKIILMVILLPAIAIIASNADYLVDSLGLNVKSIVIDRSIDPVRRQKITEQISMTDIGKRSIKELKEKIEELRWVDLVTVERIWPDRLYVNVVPRKPVAVFNDGYYLDAQGNVFVSPVVEPVQLPFLYGSEDKSLEIMSQFQRLSSTLMNEGLYLEELRLNERGVWSFTDQYGTEVILGKHSITERLKRFLAVYKSEVVGERAREMKRLDTRYSNGVSVAWKNTGDSNNLAANLQVEDEKWPVH